jgi:RNA polymerase sigma-70 factor (ECF subfamily)
MKSSFSITAAWLPSCLENESEEALVADAKLGDERALTELWRRYATVAYRVLWRITGNREDAEDALQETLLRSFVHLKSFDGRSKFSTWLISIATNTALTQLRRKRQRPELLFSSSASVFSEAMEVLGEDSIDAEAGFVHREGTELLRAAMRRLHPSLRCVIELRTKHECSIEQIATITGLSISAIKSRLHRAKSALRGLWMREISVRGNSRRPSARQVDKKEALTIPAEKMEVI